MLKEIYEQPRAIADTLRGRFDAESGEVNLERNFVIRDSDCDGSFDERYSLDEQFYVPDCLK